MSWPCSFNLIFAGAFCKQAVPKEGRAAVPTQSVLFAVLRHPCPYPGLAAVPLGEEPGSCLAPPVYGAPILG